MYINMVENENETVVLMDPLSWSITFKIANVIFKLINWMQTRKP